MDAKLLQRNRFSIDTVLKAGLFDDHVDETSSVRMEQDPVRRVRLDQSSRLPRPDRLAMQVSSHPAAVAQGRLRSHLAARRCASPGQISETYCHGTILPWEYLRRRPSASIATPASSITEPPPAWSIRSRTGPGDGGGFRRKASQWRDRWCENLLRPLPALRTVALRCPTVLARQCA